MFFDSLGGTVKTLAVVILRHRNQQRNISGFLGDPKQTTILPNNAGTATKTRIRLPNIGDEGVISDRVGLRLFLDSDAHPIDAS